MLDRITATFDTLYSPTALAADRQPPAPTRAFYAYFLRQFRGALYARFLLVAAGSLADAMLPVFVGWVVGMLSTTPPGRLFAEHGPELALMLAVVLLRPVFFVADALVRNHAITPNLVDLVRWQSHWHVIRQSWTFFQNDFAGRIGTKVMQAGEAIEMSVNLTIDAVWYAAVFVVVAVIALAGMDPLLLVPIALWLVAYAILFRWTMPNVDRISEEVSEARSVMTGRMVDSYTNIQTLKTFALDDAEDAYVAELVEGHVGVFRRLMAIFTWSWSLLFLLNALLVGSVTWIALAAWDRGTMTTAMVATAIPFVLQIMNISGWILEVGSNVFRQIGTVRDSMVTIARPLTLVDAPDAQAAGGARRRDRLRPGRLRLLARRRGRGGARLQPDGAAGRADRPRRPVGRRQVDAGQPHLADVRRGLGRDPHRRAGHPRRHPGEPAPGDRRGRAGHLAAPPLGPRQHQVRPALRQRRRDDRGGEAREHSRGDRVACRSRGQDRLRRPCRRARRQAFRRPAAAGGAGAGDPQGRADPGARRGDERARQRDRGGDPGHALPGDAGQDGDRHRPPALHHRPDGPDRGAGRGPDRRGGQPRRALARGGLYARFWERQSGGFLALEAAE